MGDQVRRVGESLIQHGPGSDRVYGMSIARADVPGIVERLEELARTEGYGKLVLKVHGGDVGAFAARGYTAEATVPGFFESGAEAAFVGKYLRPDRARPEDPDRIRRVIEVAEEAREASVEADGFHLRETTPDDVEAIAGVYRDVFETYPFPIDDPAHVRAEMERGTRYFLAEENGIVAAAASMEPGGADGVVEMTDFATRPRHRRRGLATRLLALMDRAARRRSVRVAYTIARARSFGMNITFGRRGYAYRGTLVNNTQIGGSIESMNVWSKRITPSGDPFPRPAGHRTAATPSEPS